MAFILCKIFNDVRNAPGAIPRQSKQTGRAITMLQLSHFESMTRANILPNLEKKISQFDVSKYSRMEGTYKHVCMKLDRWFREVNNCRPVKMKISSSKLP